MRFGVFVASAALVFSCVGAHGDTANPITGSGGGFSGSGTLYTSGASNSGGGYVITDITGTGVTGLIGPGVFANDNLLYVSQTPALDGQGFAFTDVMGNTGYEVDLFYSTRGYEANILDSDGYAEQIPVTFSLGSTTTTSQIFSPSLTLSAQLGSTTTGSMAVPFSFTEASAVTPEPASFALLGTGLLSLAAAGRRRRI